MEEEEDDDDDDDDREDGLEQKEGEQQQRDSNHLNEYKTAIGEGSNRLRVPELTF